MFVQIIKGSTNDRDGVRRQNARWNDELRPGATGFLGSTVGVTDDGTFFAFARFVDDVAAKANSARAEQGAWWEETAKLFNGEPAFFESSDIQLLFDGGSDSGDLVLHQFRPATD